MATKAVPLQRYPSLPPTARSIRFAPLPIPHRSTSALPGLAVSDPPFLSDDASIASSSGSSDSPQKYPVESYPTSPTPLTSRVPTSRVTPLSSHSEYPGFAHNPPNPPSANPKRRAFFRSFFRKSGGHDSLSPSSSIDLPQTPSIDSYHARQNTRRFNFSVEEILTLGTINLFRTIPRNNRYSTDNCSSPEWDLSRWPSVNSAQSAPASTLKSTPIIESPLPRPQSSRSSSRSLPPLGGKNNGSQRHSLPVRPTTNVGTPAASKNKPNRSKPFKGIRMLNGRVYGDPKRRINPFANVRDEADPEFVEWGYGGMGSVSGRHAAGMVGTRWERLQSGQSSDDPSLDDGSGMGWVKRRREAREKSKFAEEQEVSQGHAESTNGAVGPQSASAPNTGLELNSTPTAANTEADITTLDASNDVGAGTNTFTSHPPLSLNITGPASSASSSSPHSTFMKSSEGEHVLHAVTIPAYFQRHQHHRGASKGGVITSEASDEAKANPSGGPQGTESQSESSDDSDSEDSDGGDEESDTNEFGVSRRKTALGAGVEKYTRHKEAERE
ncbi:hypothetical protein AX15_004969 [Amanita polypyramis BW_CC]|nr:hypothetical protein AX15_004969 [Amanita polypyramis BW_CC]